MPPPVFKDGIFAKGALAAGQTIRLGGFLMTACPATASTMTSQVIKSNLRVSSEFAERLDPIELSSLNELLDRIAALGVATDYDRIGLKPDQREINSPPVTHQIAVVEEQYNNSSPILRTNYVRISELTEPDTRSREDMPQTPNLESDCGPEKCVFGVPAGKLLRFIVSNRGIEANTAKIRALS